MTIIKYQFILNNMSSPFLSSDEKTRGIKHHYRHQAFNGMGFNFLGDTPVSLLAIYFGATNTEIGYLSSVIYVAGLLLSVTPRIFSGKNIVQVQYLAWLLRGFVCIAYTALFFIDGRPAVLLILITYTLFCSSRIVGASLYHPVMRMISTKRTRGKVLAASSIRFQISSTISKCISFIVTSIKQLTGITGILLLSIAGVVLNTIAATELRKVPCREKISYKKGRNVFAIFSEALRSRSLRHMLFLSFLNAAMIVLFGFIIPLLRLDAGFSTSGIFLASITAALATILSAYFSKNFADRIGSRPLLIGIQVLLAVAALVWALSGIISVKPVYYAIMFLSTFFLRSNDLLIGRLLVASLPEKDSVGFSSMLNFFIAFIALFAGIAGGQLADLSRTLVIISNQNNYILTFLLAFALCIISLVITLRVREQDSLSPAEAAAIIFSPSKLSTYLSIGKLYSTSDPLQRKTLLLNIGMDSSKLATDEIRSILANPLSNDKGQMITSLFSNPRPVLLPELLKEAADECSYHRLKAIFALGAYPGRETEALLLKLVDAPDQAIASNAAKSLGRIGGISRLEQVRDLASEAEGIWNSLNFIIALKHMDKSGEYLGEVFNEKKISRGKTFNQTIYSLYADILDFEPSLSEIYKSRNMKKGQGLHDFLDESREEEAFFRNHQDFIDWFGADRLDNIWKRCREIAGQANPEPYFRPLHRSLMAFPYEKSGYDDALAAVYFTYQLLKLSRPV